MLLEHFINVKLPQCRDCTVGKTCPCTWEIHAEICSSKGAWCLQFSRVQLEEAWGRGAGERGKLRWQNVNS